jgi:tRNA pseudouridine38-40 synthase
MRNIIIHLAYDGTRYHGWQVQENSVSVQQVFQNAVEKVFGSRLDVKGCSRTDAGVHAYDYVCNFRTGATIECGAIARALNANLPKDIAVTACEEAEEGFHSRYHATGKEYIYKICNAPFRDPFYRAYALYYPKRLDCELLNRAAQDFCGCHDFSAFRSAGTVSRHRPEEPSGDAVRTIFEAEVTRNGDMVVFRVRGDGFLYNMVRIMVGTLLFVAQGKIPCGGIASVIESRDRRRAGPTAPPHALYLNRVFYPPATTRGGAIHGEDDI